MRVYAFTQVFLVHINEMNQRGSGGFVTLRHECPCNRGISSNASMDLMNFMLKHVRVGALAPCCARFLMRARGPSAAKAKRMAFLFYRGPDRDELMARRGQ